MPRFALKSFLVFTSLGAINGFLGSIFFAIGPILELGLQELHSIRLAGASPSTTAIAAKLVEKGSNLAIQIAVLEHGFETMIAGAIAAATAYLAMCFVFKFMIDGLSENSA